METKIHILNGWRLVDSKNVIIQYINPIGQGYFAEIDNEHGHMLSELTTEPYPEQSRSWYNESLYQSYKEAYAASWPDARWVYTDHIRTYNGHDWEFVAPLPGVKFSKCIQQGERNARYAHLIVIADSLKWGDQIEPAPDHYRGDMCCWDVKAPWSIGKWWNSCEDDPRRWRYGHSREEILNEYKECVGYRISFYGSNGTGRLAYQELVGVE